MFKTTPNVFPIEDVVLVKSTDESDKSLDGILPDEDDEILEILGKGTVISRGPGYTSSIGKIPITVKVGDEILFLKEKAAKFIEGEDTYYIISERDTSAVLNREPTEEEMGGHVIQDFSIFPKDPKKE